MLETISTISVCALGVVVTILIYLKDKRRKTISDLSNQIQAYWYLEKEYCQEIVRLRNEKGNISKYKQVLEEFRKKAQDNPSNENHIRPTYTAQQVRKDIF